MEERFPPPFRAISLRKAARVSATALLPRRSLLKGQWRPADLLLDEVHLYVDMVSDTDKWNPFLHAVLFPVENHRSLNFICAGPIPGNRERQLLGVCYSADRKVAIHFKRVGAGLHKLRGLKRNQWILLDVEEVFALQLAVLHAASGIHTGRLNCDL